ncbi:quinone oxidoreductase family protein [Corallococcus carmarthensis]|uniref:quinone oxidoreductase family protein n=1 Tax=Corallococcus carmarthensis TaxID=2316728 RepID=UPI00148E8D5B|nr:zinc-binding dehydrogenase [Corallococcus carmarthensis]NOK20543.1 zinc-binding dehydrogenase [Corallococcus carmarthensis]
MRAVKVERLGGPEGLVPGEVPARVPQAGQVVVAVEAAGVGLVDAFQRRGLFPGFDQPGFVPGAEVAGRVTRVGSEDAREWLGKHVFALVRTGGYAEEVVAEPAQLIPIPPGLSSVEAIALGINALVAQFSLLRAGLRAGERVLVRGAGGGIGMSVVQFAVSQGARVTAITTEARASALAGLGIESVVDRQAGSSLPGGFDVIVDPVAGPQLATFLQKLRPNGRYVLNGVAAGFPAPDFGTGFLTGFAHSPTLSLLSLDSIDPAEQSAVGQSLFELAVTRRLVPRVGKTFPLEQAAQAHAVLEEGQVTGKIVLLV